MTTDITTDINLQSIGRIALQAVYTGSPDGVLKLQAANNVATFRDLNDTKNRVVATMTGSQRTSVVKDAT
jgi:hypothetical protein